MRKTNEKGFTILEMVIVMAVIGILAGVLIPTFSGAVKKSKLSSDTQSVRNMNLALETEESLHGPAEDIETVMSILSKAGYTEEDWHTETEGYAVYWYKAENRLILYNDEEGELAYPEDFDAKLIADTKAEQLFVYNANEEKALAENILFAAKGGSLPKLENYSDFQTALSTKSVLDAMGWTSAEIKSAGKQTVNGAVLESASVNTDSAIGNAYRISLTSNDSAAQIAAGEMLYTLFAKINAGQISGPVAILLGEGAVLDVSSHEWISVNAFTGYFGTVDSTQPATIIGAKITENTAFSDVPYFTDGNFLYSFAGFFGTVYGKTTIENVNFGGSGEGTAFKISSPASDAALAKGVDSANCVGIIGGVTDHKDGTKANVLLQNVTVSDRVSITGSAVAGGLIGYVGGFGKGNTLVGTVTVENCTIAADVLSTYTAAYDEINAAPVGGFIGMSERCVNVNLHFSGNNAFTGTLNGHYDIGALIGRFSSGTLTKDTAGTVTLDGGHYNTKYFTVTSRVKVKGYFSD